MLIVLLAFVGLFVLFCFVFLYVDSLFGASLFVCLFDCLLVCLFYIRQVPKQPERVGVMLST